MAAQQLPLPASRLRPQRRAAGLLEMLRPGRLDRLLAAAGLALARRLLTDGTGPLFSAHAAGSLWDAVEEVILGLGDVRPQSP